MILLKFWLSAVRSRLWQQVLLLLYRTYSGGTFNFIYCIHLQHKILHHVRGCRYIHTSIPSQVSRYAVLQQVPIRFYIIPTYDLQKVNISLSGSIFCQHEGHCSVTRFQMLIYIYFFFKVQLIECRFLCFVISKRRTLHYII